MGEETYPKNFKKGETAGRKWGVEVAIRGDIAYGKNEGP